MLSGGYEESKKEEIVIEDISPNIFYNVLLYIYKGELQLQAISDCTALYFAADKYQIDTLKQACAKELQQHPINWDNFWDLFTGNFFITPFHLKLKLMVFLDENATAVLTNKKFLFLSHEQVMTIISRNSLREISELVLCEALARWAKMQCFKTSVEPTAENQRTALGDAFHKMKLTLINRRELIASPVYKMLTEQEKADIWEENVDSAFISALSTIPRGSNEIKQQGPGSNGSSVGLVYFVFAKDAYVHKLILRYTNTAAVAQVVLSALLEGGKDIKISYGGYSHSELASFYAKAFVCYKLSVVFRTHPPHSCVLSGCLGRESGVDKAVFFSVNEELVSDYLKLVSRDYWKNAFETQRFEPDGFGTCVHSIQATFC